MEIVRYNGYGIVEINSEDATIGMEEIVFGHTNPRARYKHHRKWFWQMVSPRQMEQEKSKHSREPLQ